MIFKASTSRKVQWRDLSAEISLNLEHVHVMEQRQFITLKLERKAPFPENLADYVTLVDQFNQAFDDHHDFKARYSASPGMMTRENALILEDKYEMLNGLFLQLKPAILSARERLDLQYGS